MRAPVSKKEEDMMNIGDGADGVFFMHCLMSEGGCVLFWGGVIIGR